MKSKRQQSSVLGAVLPITCYSVAFIGLAAVMGSTKDLFRANLQALIDDPDADWSPASVARALDVNRSTVSSWLNGNKFPRHDQIDAMAKLFNVPAARFLLDPEDNRLMTPEVAIEVLSKMVRAQRTAK